MWEIIAAALLCIFAVLGFVASMKALVFSVFNSKNQNAYVILDAKKLNADTEYTLMSWAQRAKWLGKNSFENIVIVDNGLNNDSREICLKFCKENPLFKMCTPAELLEIFK